MLLWMTLADAASALTTVYWVALIVGGGLLLISTFLGGDTNVHADTDVNLDVPSDVDLDVDANAAHAVSLATWFSTQFVVFFMAMFGVVGVVLTYSTDQSWPATLAFAIVGGLLIGQAAHQVLRAIKKSSGDSTPRELDYVNRFARVTIPIADGKSGQIMLRVGPTDRYVTASAQHNTESFARGEQVGVVAYQNGVAEVVSCKEFDFISEGGDGYTARKENS